jgi:hypothetical protein
MRVRFKFRACLIELHLGSDSNSSGEVIPNVLLEELF